MGALYYIRDNVDITNGLYVNEYSHKLYTILKIMIENSDIKKYGKELNKSFVYPDKVSDEIDTIYIYLFTWYPENCCKYGNLFKESTIFKKLESLKNNHIGINFKFREIKGTIKLNVGEEYIKDDFFSRARKIDCVPTLLLDIIYKDGRIWTKRLKKLLYNNSENETTIINEDEIYNLFPKIYNENIIIKKMIY